MQLEADRARAAEIFALAGDQRGRARERHVCHRIVNVTVEKRSTNPEPLAPKVHFGARFATREMLGGETRVGVREHVAYAEGTV